MDINEKDMDQENEKYLIRTNASEVIKNALKEAKIIKDFDNSNLFLGSKFIYFDGSIKRHINGLKSGNNKKPARMRKWFGEREWKTSEEIRDYFNPNKFNKDVSNISEIFDVFDEQINNLVHYLNKG